MSATLRSYARGDNAAVVTVGKLTVWFSYATPVAFQLAGDYRYVVRNRWGNTTGRHLNAIDGGTHASRIDQAEFEARLAEAVGGTPVGV